VGFFLGIELKIFPGQCHLLVVRHAMLVLEMMRRNL
jgi:hypothetical protein